MTADSELGERLSHLRHRARDCRRVARECRSRYVALSLDELADRLDAEAAIMAAKTDRIVRTDSASDLNH